MANIPPAGQASATESFRRKADLTAGFDCIMPDFGHGIVRAVTVKVDPELTWAITMLGTIREPESCRKSLQEDSLDSGGSICNDEVIIF
jgi:hypothetical protein